LTVSRSMSLRRNAGQIERLFVDARLSSADTTASLTIDIRSDGAEYSIRIPGVRLFEGRRAVGGVAERIDGSQRLIVSNVAASTVIHKERASYPLSSPRATLDLASALSRTELGYVLAELLRYEGVFLARMPDLRPAFFLARLAVDHAPSAIELNDDRTPPGMIVGDTPGLGMTCADNIKCPSSAPYCVKEQHEDRYGSCTRLCLTSDDCRSGVVAGACSLPVNDIPGITGYHVGCAIPCSHHACPGLLGCNEADNLCGAR